MGTAQCPEEPAPAPVACALLARREAFFRVGYFDPRLKVGIDIDWNLRAKSSGLSIKILPEVLMYRRIHPGNSGYQHQAYRRQHVGVLKAHLDRLRGSSGGGI